MSCSRVHGVERSLIFEVAGLLVMRNVHEMVNSAESSSIEHLLFRRRRRYGENMLTRLEGPAHPIIRRFYHFEAKLNRRRV